MGWADITLLIKGLHQADDSKESEQHYPPMAQLPDTLSCLENEGKRTFIEFDLDAHHTLEKSPMP